MKRTIYISVAIAIIIFMSACDMVTPVSRTERLGMFIDDLNVTANHSQMPEHFSQANMGGGWSKVTDSSYWSSSADGWDRIPFSYTITSQSGNTITASLTPNGFSAETFDFYFVEEEEDIWKIYQVDRLGTPIIQ